MKHPAQKTQFKRVPWIILALLLVLWLFLTIWSVVNVAEGILALQLFAGRSEMYIYMFVAGLQGVASLSWALIPIFFLSPKSDSGIRVTIPRILAATLLTITLLATMYFEAFHSVLITVRNSQGPSMAALEEHELRRLNDQISIISAQVAAVYDARITTIRNLAMGAAKGEDETRIAACGPICKGHWNRLAELTERFSDLAKQIPGPAATGTGVRTLYIDSVERSKLLSGYVQRLGEFQKFADKSAVPANITTGLGEVRKQLDAKAAKYNGLLEIDEKSLAVLATVNVFNKLARAEFAAVEPIYLLAVAYALVPFMSLISASVLMWGIRSYNTSFGLVDELAQEVEHEQETRGYLEKLAELKKSNWRAWLSARLYDRASRSDSPASGLSPA